MSVTKPVTWTQSPVTHSIGFNAQTGNFFTTDAQRNIVNYDLTRGPIKIMVLDADAFAANGKIKIRGQEFQVQTNMCHPNYGVTDMILTYYDTVPAGASNGPIAVGAWKTAIKPQYGDSVSYAKLVFGVINLGTPQQPNYQITRLRLRGGAGMAFGEALQAAGFQDASDCIVHLTGSTPSTTKFGMNVMKPLFKFEKRPSSQDGFAEEQDKVLQSFLADYFEKLRATITEAKLAVGQFSQVPPQQPQQYPVPQYPGPQYQAAQPQYPAQPYQAQPFAPQYQQSPYAGQLPLSPQAPQGTTGAPVQSPGYTTSTATAGYAQPQVPAQPPQAANYGTPPAHQPAVPQIVDDLPF